MALQRETEYPNRRTFVLKVRRDATPEAIAGRLENVVTGRQTEFACGRELIESIASEIRASAPQQPPAGTPADVPQQQRDTRSKEKSP